jgi:hypothetical protein
MFHHSRRLSGNPTPYRARGWEARSGLQAPRDVGEAEVSPYSGAGSGSVPTTVDILNLRLNGIINSETKHLIKRYLRKIGFLNVKVVHLSDCGPSTVTLSVTGQVNSKPTDEQRTKLNLLNDALTYTLTHPMAGLDPHPSHADPEVLRKALTKVEPSMGKVYYTRA